MNYWMSFYYYINDIYPESDGTAVSIARRMETCANKYAFKILKFR